MGELTSSTGELMDLDNLSCTVIKACGPEAVASAAKREHKEDIRHISAGTVQLACSRTCVLIQVSSSCPK